MRPPFEPRQIAARPTFPASQTVPGPYAHIDGLRSLPWGASCVRLTGEAEGRSVSIELEQRVAEELGQELGGVALKLAAAFFQRGARLHPATGRPAAFTLGIKVPANSRLRGLPLDAPAAAPRRASFQRPVRPMS
jgi:hypothetical protein